MIERGTNGILVPICKIIGTRVAGACAKPGPRDIAEDQRAWTGRGTRTCIEIRGLDAGEGGRKHGNKLNAVTSRVVRVETKRDGRSPHPVAFVPADRSPPTTSRCPATNPIPLRVQCVHSVATHPLRSSVRSWLGLPTYIPPLQTLVSRQFCGTCENRARKSRDGWKGGQTRGNFVLFQSLGQWRNWMVRRVETCGTSRGGNCGNRKVIRKWQNTLFCLICYTVGIIVFRRRDVYTRRLITREECRKKITYYLSKHFSVPPINGKFE